MTSREVPAAASSLAAALLTGPPRPVSEVARTRLSVHYETGHDEMPVLCVCTPGAVRLPNAVVADRLPDAGLTVGDGRLRSSGLTLVVRRWWRPARPQGIRADVARARLDSVAAPGEAEPTPVDLKPRALLGRGPGLTPTGDDVLAAALVTASATADPRLDRWRRATATALRERSTTAVSRGLLRHALDGYATDELAELLVALGAPADDPRLPGALRRLLAVGHSSGAALLTGVRYTIDTRQLEEAA